MATAGSLLSRFCAIYVPASRSFAHRALSLRPSLFPQLRPLVSVSEGVRFIIDCRSTASRCFSTRPTTSSIQDPSPNWSNRPPKETILLDGCDFEHWLVVVEKPDENLTRDEIIDSYIKTLAQVVGSDEEARMKIYSVSTKHYFAFGALVSEELSYKIKALPGVRWVLPDSYLDVRNKDYGGEPFINGQAVPYDPKYHEEWVRNNARANERSRRQDRPRNYDRTRNFERRRENMQGRDFQNREVPMPNFQNTVQNSSASSPQPEQSVPLQNPGQQVPPSTNAFPAQMPNPQPGYGYQSGPPGHVNQSPPGYGNQSPPGHGNQSSPPLQGYQSGPPGQGYQSGPTGQGYQSGPPGQSYQPGPPGQGFRSGPPGQGFQGSMAGTQGYQSPPPPGQGYNTVPLGGNGYQSNPPVSHGFQGGPQVGQAYQGNQPTGMGYQGGPPGGQTYQPSQPASPGYQSSPPRSPVYQPSSSAPFHGGNQPSPPGGQNGGLTSPGYHGGNNGFQGGNQSGTSEHQGGNPINTPRDIPGRDF